MPGRLIYHKSGGITARALAELMGLRATRDDKWKDNYRNPVIRWGTSSRPPHDDCTINSANAINRTSDGILSLLTMANAGLPVPQFYIVGRYTDRAGTEGRGGSITIEDLPDIHLLARKKYHRAGSDITNCPNKRAVDRAIAKGRYFFVKYIPTVREIRVHVINGEVVKVFRKYAETHYHEFIRSSKMGWHFRVVNHEKYYSYALPIAIKAVESLGLMFGAVDMACLTDDKKKWVVWEVNTAPSLNTETLQLYAEKLGELI